MNRRRLLALIGFALALAATGVASAQSRRIVLDDFEVKGKVQKPEITIFVTRQNLNPEYDLELRESFIPKIVESAKEKPF